MFRLRRSVSPRLPPSRSVSHRSIISSNSSWPLVTPERCWSITPWLNVVTSATTATVGNRSLSTPSSSRPTSNAGTSTSIQRRSTAASRSRISSWFQAIACSSNHTFWYPLSKSARRYPIAVRHLSTNGVSAAYSATCRSISRSVKRSSVWRATSSIDPK